MFYNIYICNKCIIENAPNPIDPKITSITMVIIKANTAIPNAPNQPTSNIDLYTPKIPMKPIIKPRSKRSGKLITTDIKANNAIIIINTIIETRVAAIAFGNEDSLLKTFDASQTGIEIIIHDMINPIITPIIGEICILTTFTICYISFTAKITVLSSF